MWEKDSEQEIHEEKVEKSDMAKTRYAICNSCDLFNTFKFCKSCGCYMPLKVKMTNVSCPEGKW
jgi:hypothetical protein